MAFGNSPAQRPVTLLAGAVAHSLKLNCATMKAVLRLLRTPSGDKVRNEKGPFCTKKGADVGEVSSQRSNAPQPSLGIAEIQCVLREACLPSVQSHVIAFGGARDPDRRAIRLWLKFNDSFVGRKSRTSPVSREDETPSRVG
jgi:hypothetical protein